MIRPGTFGRQKEKHNVDRLIIERLEIDPSLKPSENAGNLLDTRQFSVRNRYSSANASGAQPLTLQNRVENIPLDQAGQFGRPLRQDLQQLLF